MSDKAVTKALNRRLKQRRLPSFNIPPSADPGVAQALESIQEHLRLYEGAQGNPNERFVTLEELKNAGLVTLGTKNGFSAITSVLGETVPQAPSTSVKTSPTSGDSSGGGTPGIDSRYLRSDENDTAQGLINFNAGLRSIQDIEIDRVVNNGRPEIIFNSPTSGYGSIRYREEGVDTTRFYFGPWYGTMFQIYDSIGDEQIFEVFNTGVYFKNQKMWHAGNDGPASGLNADLLDGFDSSDFARMANAEIIEAQWTFQSDPDISGSFTSNIALTLHEETASDVAIRLQTALSNQMFLGLSDDNELYFGDATNFSVNGWKIWHENNDGAGSGLDADTVDGIEGTNMMTFAGAQVPDFQDLANFAAVGVSNGDVLVYDTTSGDFYPQSISEILAGTTQSGAGAATLNMLGDMDANLVTRTKGDMIVVNNEATNLYDRLPVGTNGQVIMADSAEALGVKWATPVTDHGALTGLSDDDHPQYTRHATAEIIDGQWTFETQVDFTGSFTANTPLILHEQTAANVALRFQTALSVQKFLGINNDGNLYFHDGQAVGSGDLIWHAGNDGTGSGLDADTVDGIEGTNMMTFAGAQVPDFEDLGNFNVIGNANGDILQWDSSQSKWTPESIQDILGGTSLSGVSAVTYYLADIATHVRTKGQLFVVNNDVSPIWDVLDVGTDDQVLTADSTTALGVKWADAAGGGVTDHGALTGLIDDDHPQYLKKAAIGIGGGNLDLIDTEAENALYAWTGTEPATGSPGWSYGVVLAVEDGAQTVQLAFGGAGHGNLAVRRKDSGTYYGWTEFWSDNNLPNPAQTTANETIDGDWNFTGDVTVYHGLATATNFRVGRSANQEFQFTVNDAEGTIAYKQDEVDATAHSWVFDFLSSNVGGARYIDFSENGTPKLRISHSGDAVSVYDGYEFRVYDATDTDYLYLKDTGAQAQIRTNTNAIRFYPAGNAGPYIETSGALYTEDDDIVRRASNTLSGMSYVDYAAATLTAGNWYTIATNPSGLDITAAPPGAGGNRAHGRFIVMDQDGGNHQSLEITASVNYGNYPYLDLKGTAYSGVTITAVRIVEEGTYAGAALQVYCGDPATIRVYMLENLQSSGWTLVTPTAETPHASWSTSSRIDVADKAVWGLNLQNTSGLFGEVTFDGENFYNIGGTASRIGAGDGTNTTYLDYAGLRMNRGASYVQNTAAGGDLRLRADTDIFLEDLAGHTWMTVADANVDIATTLTVDSSITVDDSISPSLIFQYSGAERLTIGSYNTYGYIDFGPTNDFRFYDGLTELVRINTSGLTTRDDGDGIALGNTSNTSGSAIGLYGSATNNPPYGLSFMGTSVHDTHGGVTDPWAMFFHMNNDSNRGWIFHNVTLGGVASITATGVMHLDGELYIDGDTIGHFESVTGNYGSVQVGGAEGSSGGYAGYSIDGNWVLMSNGTSLVGLYNDIDSEWGWIFRRNAELELYYNGSNVAETYSTGLRRTSQGSFLHHGSSSYLSGKVTVSTGSPSGGSNGDIWLKY